MRKSQEDKVPFFPYQYLVVLTPFADQKATDRICMGIFASSILFHRCTRLSLCRYHTVLVLEAL